MLGLKIWRSQRTVKNRKFPNNLKEQLYKYYIDTALDQYDVQKNELSLLELVFWTKLLSVSCKKATL
jgi:hypothetical protein